MNDICKKEWWEGLFCHQQGSDQNIHHQYSQYSHGVVFKKRALWTPKEIQKFAMKEMEPQMCSLILYSTKVSWPKNKECSMVYQVQLSSKYNEGEDSSNELYTLVTYVPVTTFKNYILLMWIGTNCWLSNKVVKLQKQTNKQTLQNNRPLSTRLLWGLLQKLCHPFSSAVC